jgi:hypothetical protein
MVSIGRIQAQNHKVSTAMLLLLRTNRLPERIEERIRLLCARQRDLVVEDEERHTANLMPPTQFLVLPERIHSFVTVQHRHGKLALQSSFGNHVDELLAITDVSTLGEVGSEQCLNDRILTTLLVGKRNKPVGTHGVWRPFNPIEGEMDAFCLANLNYLGVKLQRPLPTAKLSDAIFLAADAFLGHRRIELVGQPVHSNFLLAFNATYGFFEPLFAEVAPRADDVGDHFNGEIHCNSDLKMEVPHPKIPLI